MGSTHDDARLNRVLDSLMEAADASGLPAYSVPAEEFQRCLAQQQLAFGHPLVDQIMLQCRISDDGVVNFADFARTLSAPTLGSSWESEAGYAKLAALTQPAAPAEDMMLGGGDRGSDPLTSSYEFQRALAATTGVPTAPQLPPELAALPQGERVRRLGREISVLFQQFDTARITLNTFRARLAAMGIEESPEVTRMLMQSPINYAAFLRALQRDPPRDAIAAASNPSQVSLYRPDVPPSARPSEHPTTSHFTLTDGSQASASASPLPGSIARQRAAAAASARSPITGEYLRPASSASSMYGDLPGAGSDVYSSMPSSRVSRVVSPVAPLPAAGRDSRTATPTHGRAHITASGAARTAPYSAAPTESDQVAMHLQWSRDASAAASPQMPLRAAATPDQGLLREQVYSALRQLDAGTLSPKGFRAQLTALGVEVSPTVERLLASFAVTGAVDFTRFVKAFDAYFAAHGASVPEEVTASGTGTGALSWLVTGRESDAKARGGRAIVSAGEPGSARGVPQHSHGDILAWAGQYVEDPKRTESRKVDRRIYDSTGPSLDFGSSRDIATAASSGSSLSALSKPGVTTMHRRPVNPERNRDSGAVLQWNPDAATSDDLNAEFALMGGSAGRMRAAAPAANVRTAPYAPYE